LWGEANYAAFASGLEEDQMDGAGEDIKIVEAAVLGFDTSLSTEGRCVKTGFAERKPRESQKLKE
jgi:hypothetical protein